MPTRTVASDRTSIVHAQETLLRWYHQHEREFPWRRSNATLYERIVVEVLLKRTRAETIASFVPTFLRRFPSWSSLARVRETELQKVLQPIGLYRQRAADLRHLAVEIVRKRGRFPVSREEIETLPGVGQYVASAILLFRYERAEPLLDSSMARVVERVFGPRKIVDIRYDPHLQSNARTLIGGRDPIALNWAVLDVAARICLPRSPLCDVCPLAAWCRHRKTVAKQAQKPVTAKNLRT